MKILKLKTNEVLIDFGQDKDHPYSFVPEFQRLEDNETIKSQLAFEWHYLRQEVVDKLEEIFVGDEAVIIVPNPIDHPEDVYIGVWTSMFDFYDTTPNDWSQGKSGAVVFQEP